MNGRKFVTEFEIFWEDRFPIQKDFICCGVYILSYARYKLELFNGMPRSEVINFCKESPLQPLSRTNITETVLFPQPTHKLSVAWSRFVAHLLDKSP